MYAESDVEGMPERAHASKYGKWTEASPFPCSQLHELLMTSAEQGELMLVNAC